MNHDVKDVMTHFDSTKQCFAIVALEAQSVKSYQNPPLLNKLSQEGCLAMTNANCWNVQERSPNMEY